MIIFEIYANLFAEHNLSNSCLQKKNDLIIYHKQYEIMNLIQVSFKASCRFT